METGQTAHSPAATERSSFFVYYRYMLKIATHNSATGEKPIWYCYPLIPFARTQSKTIKEQYEAGCRSFDIRIKYHNGVWRCAHGIMFTKRTAWSILSEINSFPERCLVSITYEGRGHHAEEFMQEVNKIKRNFSWIIYGPIAIKYGKDSEGLKVDYETLEPAEPGYEGGSQGFLPLNGRTWHTYLPIPWLWDKLYTHPHSFNRETYTYVDFL